MDFIVADANKNEKAFLVDFEQLDIDIGKQNDFELRIPRAVSKKLALELGGFLFCPGTEYGGVITRVAVESTEDTMMWQGVTWRGLLDMDIIVPPLGHDYRVVTGEANDIIRTVLTENDSAGVFFTVPETDSGVGFTNYQFGRYITKLDGLAKMLLSEDSRLQIHVIQGAANEGFHVLCEAVPIIDHSDEIEYSDDYKLNISIAQDNGGVNHLICLGRGELRDRQVAHLYLHADGTVSETKYYSGFDERIAVGEYGSAESIDELVSNGTEKLLELASSKSLGLAVADIDVDIGDIVGGRNREFGITLKKPVVSKILRVGNNQESISIEVEGNQKNESKEIQ